MHFYTKEQLDFLRRKYPKHSRRELLQMFNSYFNLNVSLNSLVAALNNHKISSGRTGQFEKGSVPFNKGKMKTWAGGEETQFKKGHKPHNYKPVGSERIDRDGYLLIKVSDDGPWHKRWRHKHKVLWEKEYGPIPPGHVLLFADQNKQNIALDNLLLVSRKQMATINKKGLLTNDAELNRTGIILADISQKISERKKKR